MNIELKELFKVEDCSLGVEEIAKRMKIKKLTKENIRKLKGDLSLLEKAGKIYYNIVNDEYEILPAFFHTVRVNKVEDSIISFSINKNKCYLESKNKHIHKNSIIIVKQDGSKFKLVKIVEFPKDKKLNYSEKKIINALKPIYPSYTLKALKKITKNEDIKDEKPEFLHITACDARFNYQKNIFDAYEILLPNLKKLDYTCIDDARKGWQLFFCEGFEEMKRYKTEENKGILNVIRDLEMNSDFLSEYEKEQVEEAMIGGIKDEAKQEEKLEIAKTMKSDNESLDKIIKYTGLSEEEINNL